MRILIIEDDELKRAQLALLIQTNDAMAFIEFAKSMNSGMRAVLENSYDLILLDMSMPTFDVDVEENGGNPQYYGGSEILYEMDRHNISTPVIVVTQFDKFGEKNNELTLNELDHQLKEDILRNYKGAIYYNSALNDWKIELINKIQELKNA
jgi:chemotaxis response regulator CheB